MDNFDLSQLPFDIRTRLAELELELSEGDITEKGYLKKKAKLLSPYLSTANENNQSNEAHAHQITASPGPHIPFGAVGLPGLVGNNLEDRLRPHRESSDDESSETGDGSRAEIDHDDGSTHIQSRRHIRDDGRFRSEIREEAVREALAQSRSNRLEALLPSKRVSSLRDNQNDSDDDISSESSSRLTAEVSFENQNIPMMDDYQHTPFVPQQQQHPSSQHQLNRLATRSNPNNQLSASSGNLPTPLSVQPVGLATADSFEQLAAQAVVQLGFSSFSDASCSPVAPVSDSMSQPPVSLSHSPWSGGQLRPAASSAVHATPPPTSDSPHRKAMFGGVSVLPQIPQPSADLSVAPSAQPSDLGSVDSSSAREAHDSFESHGSRDNIPPAGPIFHNRVSEKIQQLVSTLKRPKRRPLPEYFLDEDDQVLVCPMVDPSAPRPQGPPSQPIRGEELVVPSGLPRNIESALQRYASLSCKTPVLTCLDNTGRPTQVLTYAGLLNRSLRIAYMLLNKLGHRGEQSLRPREHVVLVYANNEPISFLAAFYGCILASLVPIAVEVPSVRKDSISQSMGFLLPSQNVRVALTSEQCYKALPRGPNGDIAPIPGWSSLSWVNTDHRSSGCKPPKDWVPPDRAPNEETLYTEYTFTKDGSVHAVVVCRRAALAHCRALTVACNYTEEDVMVCVVDCRREIGLWHAVLTSVFNGLHVIFVPYSVMQVDPGSWLRMVTKYRASVAIVKSRDMHWALLAERDHPNVNLSSLRMLLVADGSNPWSLNSCESFAQKFSSRGLRPDVICPAAGSSETLTLCLRRPPPNPYHGGPATNGKVLANGSHTASPGHSAGQQLLSAVRGVISIHSLAYGVVRVDSDDSLTSLTMQDSGQVLPGASAIVVRLGPKPIMCRTDEVGEICLASDYTGSGFWGLRGQSSAYFSVEPLKEDGSPVNSSTPLTYVRSGLLGFPSPASSGSLIFICGSLNGLMTIAGRRHNADDIIATVLAVQPTRIVYRCRIAVFSVDLLKDERLVVVAELRHGFSDEMAFSWMSLVLQAVDSIHQVSIYCLALVPQNSLPRTPFGGINYNLTKRLFSEGRLRPTALLLCPHSAVQNLPQPRQPRPSLVGPSAIMCGQVVQGARMAEAHGRPLPVNPMPTTEPPSAPQDKVQLLTEVLVWRASHTPDDRLFTVYNQKGQECASLTCIQLLNRADRLGCFLLDKAKATVGTVIALVYPPGIEMVSAFYACLLIGAIPVPIRPPRPEPVVDPASYTGSHSVPGSMTHLPGHSGSNTSPGLGLFGHSGSTQSSSGSSATINIRPHAQSFEASLELMWNVVKHSNASVILTQQSVIKLLKSKDATSHIPYSNWPTILDSEENIRRKGTALHQNLCTEQPVAYMDFAASTTGTLTGIRVTHQTVHALCLAQKVQCEFYPTREVVLSLDPYSGLGFTLWALTSVYCGHHSILVPPSVTELVPDLWLTVCSQRKVRDAFCSPYTMELATQYMTKHLTVFKPRDFSLSHLRSLVVVAEERPPVPLTSTFTKLFSAFGLTSRALSTSFGCRVNVAISLQGASSPESTAVYVDRISLRNDRVKLLEKGSPNSQCLVESGKLLPGVHVAIANPETFGQCADSQLGEIWVSSAHNSPELLGPFENASLSRANPGTTSQPILGVNSAADVLCAKLVTGDTERVYARTGYLGFVRRTDLTQSNGEFHDAIFVVGSLEEAIMLRGMRYHAVDIENTVMRAHRQICECAVFTWSNLLVVVAELVGEENEAMDLVHPITASVLEAHQLIVGVVVVTDPATVPINSCGQKQRILLRDSFVNDKLDPIYVSYNM